VNQLLFNRLGTKEIVEQVAAKLREHKIQTIVVDPVMISSSGHKLLQDDAVAAYRNRCKCVYFV
jgi:hydroxymethylpyrimidine/phosphomethylpyrimidine kinase